MCGRFSHLFTWRQLHRLMGLTSATEPPSELPQRYNVAPTQSAPVVRVLSTGERDASMLRWGLIPSWAKDAGIASHTVNARCETLSEKPAFRAAFKMRRCIVPISGFYEWQKLGPGAPNDSLTQSAHRISGRKQPLYITGADREPLALAGLWESWRDPAAERTQDVPPQPIETFTILTTRPNQLMARFHDRMPVIIPHEHLARWLDPANDVPTSLTDFFTPYPAELMMATAVSARVNSPRFDDEQCIKPLAPPTSEAQPSIDRKGHRPAQGTLF